jgi:hypothetical protein
MTSLPPEPSRAIHALLGNYETKYFYDDEGELFPFNDGYSYYDGCVPAPNFAEVVRVMIKIGQKKGWMMMGGVASQDTHFITTKLAWTYAMAPTEPKGMEEVGKLLMKLL